MSEPILEAGGDPAGSSFQTTVATLVSPAEGFARLRVRPAFGLALAFLLLAGAVSVWVAMSRVTAEDFIDSIEAAGRPVPDAVRDDPDRFLTVARGSQTAFAVVGPAAVYAVVAGLFFGLIRLSGGDLRYRQSFATTVHGLLPFAIAAVLGTVVALGRDTISLEELKWGGVLATNLGIFAGEGAGDVTRALLTSVDLFSVWCIYLLATGFRIVAGMSARAAWLVVLAVWLGGVGLKVAATAIF
jgi:hypothetical protein